jgi:hypothetical protein
MNQRKIVFSLIGVIYSLHTSAQDPLLQSLNDSLSATPRKEYVRGTFKALYIVNMKTIEAPAGGALNVEFQHRFGTINSGAYNLFGLDFATLRLSLDYGISDRLSAGIGRSSYLQTFDGYLKYKLLRQTADARQMPVSVSLLGTSGYFTHRFYGKDTILDNIYRLSYTAQALIARKFNNLFSFELTPTFIHYNMVPTVADRNNVFALSGGARMKISKRMAFTAEYNYLFPNQLVSVPHTNSFSLGWDIETGGHVFQLIFTNSVSMVESQYIGQTTESWSNGGIYFGFNLSRNFNLKAHQ